MSNQKDVSAPSNGVSQGPRGDECHIQIQAGRDGDESSSRSKTMGSAGYTVKGGAVPSRKMTKGPAGYSVTSPAPTPSQTRDLEDRP
jgi:hypothetical protein